MWLDDLYVHPPARQQGAGPLLMRRLAELSTVADCTHIACVASASNSIGMDFYRRFGASVIHQADDAVTLQIEPAALLEAIAPPKKAL
jgi:ribosomal protein S18 acetylase RimI-like enzyme